MTFTQLVTYFDIEAHLLCLLRILYKSFANNHESWAVLVSLLLSLLKKTILLPKETFALCSHVIIIAPKQTPTSTRLRVSEWENRAR